MKYISPNQRISTDKGFLLPTQITEDFLLCGHNKQLSAKNLKLQEKNIPHHKITLSNGMTYTGLPDNELVSKYNTIKCKDLKIGDSVLVQYHNKFSFFGNLDMEGVAFNLGIEEVMFCDEEGQKLITDWQEEQHKAGRIFASDGELMETMMKEEVIGKIKWKKKINHVKLEEKVPDWLWKSNSKTHAAYIHALFSSNCKYTSRKGKKVQYLETDNIAFLQDIQLIFANMGFSYLIKENVLIIDFNFKKVAYDVAKIDGSVNDVYSFELDDDYYVCNGAVIK